MEACFFCGKSSKILFACLFLLNPFYQLYLIQKAEKITTFTWRFQLQHDSFHVFFWVGGDEKPAVVVVVKHLAVCPQGVLWPFGSRWCYWKIWYVRVQRTSVSTRAGQKKNLQIRRAFFFWIGKKWFPLAVFCLTHWKIPCLLVFLNLKNPNIF